VLFCSHDIDYTELRALIRRKRKCTVTAGELAVELFRGRFDRSLDRIDGSTIALSINNVLRTMGWEQTTARRRTLGTDYLVFARGEASYQARCLALGRRKHAFADILG
jgi:hypothetical protein